MFNNYPALIPVLIVDDIYKARDFFQDCFDFEIVKELDGNDNSPVQIQLKTGNSYIFLNTAGITEETEANKLNSKSCFFHLSVNNPDECLKKALLKGAELWRKPEDTFWGSCSSLLRDPFGYFWMLSGDLDPVEPELLDTILGK
ncbi:VOC family protein [Candidatus Riflebacteria bacterium]